MVGTQYCRSDEAILNHPFMDYSASFTFSTGPWKTEGAISVEKFKWHNFKFKAQLSSICVSKIKLISPFNYVSFVIIFIPW